MRARLFLTCLILLGLPMTAGANPVPDEVALEFRNLVDATITTGTCPDPTRLTHHFGSFGLDLLDPGQRRGIAVNFDAFAPLLAASQTPEHRPHYAIHRLYRRYADTDQRALMLRSLRRWLTEEIEQAPREGSMRIMGPDELVREIIDHCRVVAAEMLGDWQDEASAATMANLQPKCDERSNCLEVLHWACLRLTDPCAGRVLALDSSESLQFCVTGSDLKSITLPDDDPYTLTDRERQHAWDLLIAAQPDTNSRWAGGPRHVVLTFTNGCEVKLSPTEPDRLVWTDNTTLDRRRRLTIRSRPLHAFIKGLPASAAER